MQHGGRCCRKKGRWEEWRNQKIWRRPRLSLFLFGFHPSLEMTIIGDYSYRVIQIYDI